ncbi:MAG: DNA polymerase III subunit delta', partial [Porticoccaceae bacterium]|nr:DNA polymerase III subunit delta' [Porticoccaceae bacterium]
MTDSTPTSLAMPYPWQGELWDDIVHLHKKQRLPHALMLTGPADVGKSRFARALAQRVACGEPVGGYACGTCKSCKLIAAESFPDLKRVAPEEAGKAIKIDQIRALCDFMAKTAQQGGWKVALIEPAEAMNVNAANALLKTLEEPSNNTLLILVCHQLSRVPAT